MLVVIQNRYKAKKNRLLEKPPNTHGRPGPVGRNFVWCYPAYNTPHSLQALRALHALHTNANATRQPTITRTSSRSRPSPAYGQVPTAPATPRPPQRLRTAGYTPVSSPSSVSSTVDTDESVTGHAHSGASITPEITSLGFSTVYVSSSLPIAPGNLYDCVTK